MEDIIDIIVTETTNLIEITSQPTDEIIDVNIIDNREDVTLNVTPTLVEININSLTGNFGILWGEIEGTLSNQTDLQNALNLKADLVDGKVPSSQLPSYVDDVVEVTNYAALPVTGEVGKIYITLDTNYIYRWTGSVYVEIKDSSAVWGAITGTLSNQTDLQNALNAKANDNAVVHLAGTETITGAKTFSSAVTAPNFVLSGGTGNTGLYYGHTDRVVLANYTTGGIDFEVNGGSIVATLFPSGNYGLGITLDAGYKLDVNGTARISGALSGTSASFSSSITASSIIKSGGTSSQFLKADGSIDTNTYLTTSAAASTYLPLTGGTLTGDLTLSSTNPRLYFTDTDNNPDYFISNTDGTFTVYDVTNSQARFTIGTTGNATFTNAITGGGSITGQSLYSNGIVSVGTYLIMPANNTVGGTNYYIGQQMAGSDYWRIFGNSVSADQGELVFSLGDNGVPIASNGQRFRFYYDASADGTSKDALIIDYNTSTFTTSLVATGATLTGALSGTSATFSSTLTAGTILSNTISPISGNLTIALAGASNNLLITGGNNVGIGLTSPQSALDVLQEIRVSFASANQYRVRIYNTDGNGRIFVDGDTTALIFGTSPSGVGAIATEKMRITSGGNVGIGTTAPTAFSGYTVLSINNATQGGILELQSNTTSALRMACSTADSALWEPRNVPLLFATNNTPRMSILAGGNVGIGTTSPSDYSGYTTLHINGKSGANGGVLRLTAYDSTSSANIYAGGSALNINTTSAVPIKFLTRDTTRMQILDSGAIIAGNLIGNQYSMTSGSGTGTAIVDTGITYNTGDYGGYGRGVTYEVVFNGNPNGNGSAAYFAQYMGILIIYTGWSGSAVTTYIQYTQLAGGNNIGALTLTPVFWNGSTESSSIGVYTTGAQIRLKISGYNSGATGQDQSVYLRRIS